ncbi:hypothetical protein ACFSKM_01635 [Ancylobacter dichloromethanicus]
MARLELVAFALGATLKFQGLGLRPSSDDNWIGVYLAQFDDFLRWRTNRIDFETHDGTPPQTPFRYITDHAVILPASEFEAGIDLFLSQVLERLSWAGIEDSNLQTVWSGVIAERKTPALVRTRKLEALLGQDPDSQEQLVDQLVRDIEDLGLSGVEELAAEHGQSGKLLTGDDLREAASEERFRCLAPRCHSATSY